MTMAVNTKRSLLFLFITGILFLSAQTPTFAVYDQVEATITVEQVLKVEYTGSKEIVFVVTEKDLNEGSMMLVDQGDLIWWSNVPDWDIWIERTDWVTDGNPDLKLLLQAHYGPPPPAPPPPPDFIEVTTTAVIWIKGGGTGSDTFVGVDWKIKFPYEKDEWWKNTPGTYTCTVTITIKVR
jgi:hypothetical protein